MTRRISDRHQETKVWCRVISDDDLGRMYPELNHPIRCENGCGTVISIIGAYRSYQRREDGSVKLICQCCASEIGHLDEEGEGHDESPVCKRPIKRGLK